MKTGATTDFPTPGFARTKRRLSAEAKVNPPNCWRSMLACVVVFQLFWTSAAHAQVPSPLPTVTRAVDVFDVYPASVPVGSRIALKAKNSPAIRNLLGLGLQVRIFTLGKNEVRPTPIDTIDNCDVFLATVLAVDRLGESELVIQPLGAGWLTLSDTETTIEPGKYYLVFEKTGPTSPQFRLRHGDFKDYFDTGFQLLVEKNQRVSLKEVVDARYAQFDRNAALVRDIRSKGKEPCYTYRRLSAEAGSDTQLALGEMELCRNLAPEAPKM